MNNNKYVTKMYLNNLNIVLAKRIYIYISTLHFQRDEAVVLYAIIKKKQQLQTV